MNKLLSYFLIGFLVSNFLVADTRQHEMSSGPFIAVYAGPKDHEVYERYDSVINLYFETDNFGNFPTFLQLVKERAGSRKIVIDICCHGEDWGIALFPDGNTDDTEASIGYLCNEIDAHLNPKKVTVLCEACYSGRALHNTIRNNIPGKFFEDHAGKIQYPFYGIGAQTVNMGNFVFLQWLKNQHFFFEDLRKYDNDKPLPARLTDDLWGTPLATFLFFDWVALDEAM